MKITCLCLLNCEKFCYTRKNKIKQRGIMKKIAALVSTLSLLANGVLNIASIDALGDVGFGLGNGLKVALLGAENVPSGAVKRGLAANGLMANVYDERLQFLRIVPEEGLFELRLGEFTYDYAWTLRRAIVATYNYNDGITEAEADVYALDLGEEQVVGWTQSRLDIPIDTIASGGFWLENNVVKADLTKVNRSDILYYALEFENLSNPAAGSEWIRGKLDYRSCVHAPSFRLGENMTCRAEIDYDVGKYVFLAPEEYTETEGILSWKEELLEVLRERLSEIRDEIVIQEEIKSIGGEVGEWWVESRESWLNQEVLVIEKLGYQEVLQPEVSDLANRLRNLRSSDGGVEGEDGTGVGDSDDVDNSGGSGGSDDVTDGGEGGIGGGFDIPDGSGGGSNVPNVDGAGLDSNDMAVGGAVANLGWGVQVSDGKHVLTDGSRGKISEGEAQDYVRLNSEVASQQGVEGDKGDIAVPKLGGEEDATSSNWMKRVSWLIIMAFCGLLMILVRWIKRRRVRG